MKVISGGYKQCVVSLIACGHVWRLKLPSEMRYSLYLVLSFRGSLLDIAYLEIKQKELFGWNGYDILHVLLLTILISLLSCQDVNIGIRYRRLAKCF